MTLGNQLANRLREVIVNGAWIANTNLKDQLKDIDWKIANKEIHSLNSISNLARHIHYYIAGVKQALTKGTIEIKDAYSFDFSPIRSQKEWKTFQNKFWEDTEKLALFIEKMPEAELKKSFIDKKYGNYLRNIDGLIEHSYYHLGQIVLIKKMLYS